MCNLGKFLDVTVDLYFLLMFWVLDKNVVEKI